MRIHYLLLALFSFDLHVSGQEVNITFDEKDYGSVSAYDYWTGSPLSERQLDRLAEVTDNPFSDARNSGGKVLSFRRSHHGSHLCGAKITLIEPLGLTPKTGYLHVMVHKPLSGKMALIGLGKRKGWDSQDENTMQFIKSSVRDIPAGQWEDAVFELYGNDMAELHSIVITAVYILRVVGKILYGTCTNSEHLKLTDATWDERLAVICLIFAVAGLGLAPFWVSDMISDSVEPIISHLIH